jgi:hypothetical protein
LFRRNILCSEGVPLKQLPLLLRETCRKCNGTNEKLRHIGKGSECRHRDTCTGCTGI